MIQPGKQLEAGERNYVWIFKGETIILKGKEIWYVHTEQRKLFVHTRSKSYRVGGNMKGAVAFLKDLPMIKTHASYLVRLDCLESVNGHRALLKNGAALPVSEHCWKELRPLLERYYIRRHEVSVQD